ncbi:MAG TPA: hypothetical protein VMR34_04920 [Candidatus Saccharimonadales bacterium]|nr:hypothetical protein [Candidatus Saccharimonadales bacterium]
MEGSPQKPMSPSDEYVRWISETTLNNPEALQEIIDFQSRMLGQTTDTEEAAKLQASIAGNQGRLDRLLGTS